MKIKVFDFYRLSESKEDINPFTPVLQDPSFCIKISDNGRIRELILNLKGEFPYVFYPMHCGYEENAYKNYKIIKECLLGNEEQYLKDKWKLEDKEYTKLIFEIKKALINNYSFYGNFKKKLLILLEYLKFQTGRIGK